MKKTHVILKASAVVAFSFFAMGNTQCQQPAVEQRELKKNIKVIQLNASSFLDNGGFNFSEVARSQYSGVLFEKNHFFERNIYPSTDTITVNRPQVMGNQKISVQQKITTLGTSDSSVEQLKTWFPSLKSQEILLNRESACLMSRGQHFIMGKINSLEAYGGGSLQFGFNQSLVQLPLSAHLSIDKMRMDLSFHAIDPWTQEVIDSQNAEVIKNDYKAGFGVDLGIIHIGPEFYRTTGMAEVTLKGLQAATEKLAVSLLSRPRQEWSTRIMYSRDNYVVIVGGAELGLRKGDQLKVFNEVHTWMGEACGESSILEGSTVVSDAANPWIIEIEDAGNLMSKAKVLNVKENESISTGALVQLHKFVQPGPASTAK